jgi:hypothetical protein
VPAQHRRGRREKDAQITSKTRCFRAYSNGTRGRLPRDSVEALTPQQKIVQGDQREGELEARLETPLPVQLAVGGGTALFVAGWCFHRRRGIPDLRIGPPGHEVSAIAHAMPRPDVFRAHHPLLDRDTDAALECDEDSLDDPFLMSYGSGFWGIVPFEPVQQPTSVEMGAIATLDDGTAARAALGRIELYPGLREDPVARANGHGPGSLIAICMATQEPPLDLFERQVESIRSQTHANWICLVSDDRSSPARFADIQRILDGDARFMLSQAPRHLGAYHNFERALSMAPPSAAYVCLADQDDRWHPDKLTTLLESLGSADLVYSDARIVDRRGAVISDTYWSGRRNNYTNFASLLVTNTVTGAASLFRRELLNLALPFPPRHGLPFHDHWLAVVALATGRIAYVDEPLYDYVQHGGASLGHAGANAIGLRTLRGLSRVARMLRDPSRSFNAWRAIYFADVCRLIQLATVLERRCGDRMSSRKRRTIHRVAGIEASPGAASWLALRWSRRLLGRNETLGTEGALLKGMAWRQALPLVARNSRRRWTEPWANASPAPPTPQSGVRLPIEHRATQSLAEKIRPLRIDVREEAPSRVNMLVPTIDLGRLGGGYTAQLNLARRLTDRGLRVRVVAVEATPPLPRSWRRMADSHSGLDGIFNRLELAFAREREVLEVSPTDRFIATIWSTAHVAHGALQAVGRERFLYLIHDYEPFSVPIGAFAALASQSYELPHFALFSTELLRDYFRSHRFGVFSGDGADGDRQSAAFARAIGPADAPTARELAERRSRRLLFYARPESRGAVNMFELGAIALARAAADGVFSPDWEFHGIGTRERSDPLALGSGAVLEMTPRRPPAEYAKLLRAHDVGLALAYTPHPSMPAIEMASAGMLTVTNSFENKTSQAVNAISSNLITVEASLEGLDAGLREAVAGVDDCVRRTRGSEVHWSHDWDEAFNDALMERVVSLLEAT